MRQTEQRRGEKTWPVLATPADKVTKFVDPPRPANDTVSLAPVLRRPVRRSACADPGEEDRFFRAVKATASWAMTQTIFGFALYGSSVYPYFLERGWHPDEYLPPEPTSLPSRAADEPYRRSPHREERPVRRVTSRAVTSTASLFARLGSWLAGSAR